MNKKKFWTGFLTGSILTVLAIALIIRNFIVQPDISLTKIKVQDLSGKPVNVNELIGKPLVINYWATWCAPCRHEFPEFQNAKNKWNDNVNFLMVSDESIQVIEKFQKNNSFNFNYIKCLDGFQEISSRPTTFFYDKSGKLITKKTGTINEKEIDEILQKLK